MKSNPLPPTKLQSVAGDLSFAEMPEVIVVTDKNEEPVGNIPAPLTVADVEGGDLKPIPSQPAKKAQPNPPIDPEISQVRFKTLDGRLNLLLPTDKKIKLPFNLIDNAKTAVAEKQEPNDPETSVKFIWISIINFSQFLNL